ncbi:MAG TPA: Fur family transcriptional regulator [Burkholderiaceae bacterium]|nr:Fur family transcriptional regulator [Burkholderiaceae bacterium]
MERSTRQRAAIRGAIEAAGRPLSPQEVLDAARQETPTLGLATVYRNLKLLLEEGAIELVALPGDIARYESAGREHHHHFQCDECHRVFDIPDHPADLAPLAPAGFTVARHDITLYGRCRDCQLVRPRKGKKPLAHAVRPRAGD